MNFSVFRSKKSSLNICRKPLLAGWWHLPFVSRFLKSCCWWKESGHHQLRLVVYPIICKVSYIPGRAGFQRVCLWSILELGNFTAVSREFSGAPYSSSSCLPIMVLQMSFKVRTTPKTNTPANSLWSLDRIVICGPFLSNVYHQSPNKKLGLSYLYTIKKYDQPNKIHFEVQILLKLPYMCIVWSLHYMSNLCN